MDFPALCARAHLSVADATVDYVADATVDYVADATVDYVADATVDYAPGGAVDFPALRARAHISASLWIRG